MATARTAAVSHRASDVREKSPAGGCENECRAATCNAGRVCVSDSESDGALRAGTLCRGVKSSIQLEEDLEESTVTRRYPHSDLLSIVYRVFRPLPGHATHRHSSPRPHPSSFVYPRYLSRDQHEPWTLHAKL